MLTNLNTVIVSFLITKIVKKIDSGIKMFLLNIGLNIYYLCDFGQFNYYSVLSFV